MFSLIGQIIVTKLVCGTTESKFGAAHEIERSAAVAVLMRSSLVFFMSAQRRDYNKNSVTFKTYYCKECAAPKLSKGEDTLKANKQSLSPTSKKLVYVFNI